MRRVKKEAPTKEHLAKLWYSPDWSVRSIAARFGVGYDTVVGWANRWNFGPRPEISRSPSIEVRRRSARRRVPSFSNNCCPDNHGPEPGDPTPDDLLELTSYALARRIMQGEEVGSFVREYAS